MKKKILILAALVAFFSTAQAQGIAMSQVPSVILNEFNKQFSKARDLDWELDNDLFEVEFETQWGRKHTAFYDLTGNLVRHEEELAEGELPDAIRKSLTKDFAGYSIDEAICITEKGVKFYQLDLEALLKQDWEVVFDDEGNLKSKLAD